MKIRDKIANIGPNFGFSVLESTPVVTLVTNISYANSCISLHNFQNWSEQVEGHFLCLELYAPNQ